MATESGQPRQLRPFKPRGTWLPAWVRGPLWILAALLLGAGAVLGARQVQLYSRQTVENRIRNLLAGDRGIDLRIAFTATPPWMDAALSNQILAEAQLF